MKIRHLLLILPLALWLTSCGKSDDGKNAEQAETTPQEEVAVEAPRTLPKTKAFYAGLLEEFFQKHYSECFNGSTYTNGTISIIKMAFSDEQEGNENADSTEEAVPTDNQELTAEIVGTHTYVGPAGYDVTGQKFKAIISVVNNGFKIIPYRESTQVLTSKSFWEKGDEEIVYEN